MSLNKKKIQTNSEFNSQYYIRLHYLIPCHIKLYFFLNHLFCIINNIATIWIHQSLLLLTFYVKSDDLLIVCLLFSKIDKDPQIIINLSGR